MSTPLPATSGPSASQVGSAAETAIPPAADVDASRRAIQRIPARMILIVGSLAIFGPLCIDTYLPSLPAIGRDLGASASAVQASITSCLLGLAAGQLLVGPLSDRLGRRRPLVFGLLFFVLASAGCAFAPNIETLIGLRFLQGVGASAGLVTGRAVVRDQYSGLAAARFFSLLMIVVGVGPILAPQLGSGLLHFGSWRFVFGAFVIAGLILLTISVFVLPETLPPERRHSGGFMVTLRAMGAIGRQRAFLVNALAMGLGLGELFAYIGGSSFALENVYGLSPEQYSIAFGVNAVGLVGASQINGRLIGRVSTYKLLTGGLFGLALGGIALLVVVATGFGGLTALLICTFIVLSSNGFVGPNAQALALNDFPHAAGSASALLGVMQFGIGAGVAPLVGLGGPHDVLPMAIVMATMGVLAVIIRLALAAPPQRSAVQEVALPVAEPS